MQNKIDVLRAWKDQDYRNSLSPEELANLPESPISILEDDMAKLIKGGESYGNINTVSKECWGFCCSASNSTPTTGGAITCPGIYNTNGSYC